MRLPIAAVCWFVLGLSMALAVDGLIARTWWGLALCLVCGVGAGYLISVEWMNRPAKS